MEGSKYQFPHLTFHEFFAGRCLARKLKSLDPEVREEASDYITRNKYLERHKIMLSFMASAFVEARGRRGLMDLFSILDKPPVEILGLQHLFLKLKILNASLSIEKKGIVEQLLNEPEVKILASTMGDIFVRAMNEGPLVETILMNLEQLSHVIRKHPNEVLSPLIKQLELTSTEWYFLGELERISRHSPEIEERVMRILSKKSESDDLHERRLAMTYAASALLYAQCTPKRLIEILGNGLEDEKHVRVEAFIQIASAAQQAPYLLTNLRSALGRLEQKQLSMLFAEYAYVLFHENFRGHVRGPAQKLLKKQWMMVERQKGAKKIIVSTIKIWGGDEEYLETLVAGSKDEDKYVRRASVLQILAAFDISPPHRTDELFEILMTRAKDEDEYVRAAVIFQITDGIAVSPHKTDELFEILSAGSKDESRIVRYAVMLCITDALAVTPHKADELLEMLMVGARDGSWMVRDAAIFQIVRSLIASPHKSNELLNVFAAGANDEEEEVRFSAMLQIAGVSAVAPLRTGALLKMLTENATDKNWSMRCATMLQIADMLAFAPQRTDALLETLVEGVKDTDRSVRAAAISTLRKINLIDLLDLSLKNNTREIVEVIVEELFDVAATIQETSDKRIVKLVINSATQDMSEWCKPYSDVCKLIRNIAEVVEVKLPGLSSLLTSKGRKCLG